MILLSAFICHRKRRRRQKNQQSFDSGNAYIKPSPTTRDPDEEANTCFGIPIFTYGELEEATNRFDSDKELGDGGFDTQRGRDRCCAARGSGDVLGEEIVRAESVGEDGGEVLVLAVVVFNL
ncbi:unnamed protein product [Linum trigynum]|uniref:Uncharacterized protein n=1 Tax=Linum trigynum TaxID=586398 RepID=A0AAV2GT88_9ROSI